MRTKKKITKTLKKLDLIIIKKNKLNSYQLIQIQNLQKNNDFKNLFITSSSPSPSKLKNENEYAIYFKNKIIGYTEINNHILPKKIPQNPKNIPKCWKFYIDNSYIHLLSVFISTFLQLLPKLHINIYDLWVAVPKTDFNTFPILLSKNFIFAGNVPNTNLNSFIYNFKLKHQHFKKYHSIKLNQKHNKNIDYNDIPEIDNINLFTSGPFRNYENTFILSIRTKKPYLNYNYLNQYCSNSASNLLEVKSPYRKPVFMFLEELENNMLDKRYYNTNCYIMNILNKRKYAISNKYALYFNFNRLFPRQCAKYMPSTYDLTNFDNNLILKDKGVYIIRPVGPFAFSGNDIVIAHDKNSLNKAKKLIKKYEYVIATEYVSNPLLWNGKKLHLRCFFLASIINGVFTTYFFDFYRIYHAKLPFILGDWHNPAIHDTHLKSTDTNVFAPEDIIDPEMKRKFIEIVNPKIEDCMFYVSKILEPYCEPYPNAVNAFEIFGVDIMVRDNYDIVLVEINEHTGLELKPEPIKIEEFSMKYCERINEMIINPAINGIPCKYKPIYTNKILK